MQDTRTLPPLHEAPVYGYASLSLDRGGVANEELREQAEAISAACERLDLELLQVVSERQPASGKGVGRPGLEYALKRISAGDAGGLMVCDLFRLTRSPSELGAILDWFVQRGTRLISVAEEIDTAQHSGVMVARALIELSDRERERITARTRRGLQAVRRNGHPPRRPAVADNTALRERIGHMRDDGMSLQAIADRLNAEGVPTVRGGAKWRPSSLQSVTGYRRREHGLAALLEA